MTRIIFQAVEKVLGMATFRKDMRSVQSAQIQKEVEARTLAANA
jgi:hypothetical protein